MRIWLKLDRMRAYRISSDDVMKAVGEQSVIGTPDDLARRRAWCRNPVSTSSLIKAATTSRSSMPTSF